MKMPNKVLLGLLLFISAGLIYSWFSQLNPTSGYNFESVVLSNVSEQPAVSVPGNIVGPDHIPLYARTDGVVTKILVQPGMSVKSGQILAMLDVDSEAMRLMEKLNDPTHSSVFDMDLKQSVEQIRRLQSSGYYNRAEAGEQRVQLTKNIRDMVLYAQAIGDLRKKTEGKVIRAPFDGVVTEVNWQLGEYISAQRQEMPAVSVVKPNAQLQLRLEVPDELISLVRPEAPIRISVPLSNQALATASVTSVSRAAFSDKKTRYFVVNAVINQSEAVQSLKWGMRIIATIDVTHGKEGVWLPRASLDLAIPDEMVSQTISYIEENESQLSRARTKAEVARAETLKSNSEKSEETPVSRAIATEAQSNTQNSNSIYILNSANRLIRVILPIGASNENLVFSPIKALENARVVTHYSRKKDYVRRLLGKSL